MDSVTMHDFENARFEWRSSSWTERFDVELGLLGNEYVAISVLDGDPAFLSGTARVWKVHPSKGEKSVFATGFSNIISLTFGPDCSLYVLQMAKDGYMNPDAGGALYRIAPDGTRTLVASDRLMLLLGVAVLATGEIYISNNGLIPDEGKFIKLTR